MIELRQIAKLFLRLTVAASMLSSVADRFGIWAKELCMWGDMDKFVAYTQSLIPYIPADVVPILAWTACGKGIWEVDNLMGNRRHNDRRIQMIR